jgi:hypothetical protein
MHYFESSEIKALSLHFIGNKGNDEKMILSNKLLSLNLNIRDILSKYFLESFKSEEYYKFYHDSALSLNEVYTFVSSIFKNPTDLHNQSINLAKHLYNQSNHPKIKGGEFYVVYFQHCILNGETIDAVGLFKSENKDTFLKVYSNKDNFEIDSEYGVNINRLDKGCIIFNTDKEDGYTVSVVDNTNKGIEAQFWIDNFLQIQQKLDKYFNTSATLSIYKNYVLNQLPEEYVVNKVDQADFLNRSIQFFKEKDNFEIEEFNHEVLQHSQFIDSFNQFRNKYKQESKIELADSFTISGAAVKSQSRKYKSVIKLDNNFHIYIHGNRKLIEQGEDNGGRFYKIYFQEEN